MQLDRLTVALRPRTDWEAVDLGLRLAQRYSGVAYAVWFLASLPWFALILYVGSAMQQPVLMFLALWWIKPLFERPLLHVFSRVVFGDRPGRDEWLGIAMRQPYTAGFFAALTWRRFEFSRSFNLAVRQLERLTGSARRQRLQVLHMNTGASALSLSVMSSALVLLGTLTVFVVALSITEKLFFALDPMQTSNLLDIVYEKVAASDIPWPEIIATVYWVCEGLVAPFYVGAGFTLYLNRRTHLEAWDVELSFRQMLSRRASAGAVLAALALCLFSAPPAAHADQSADPLAQARDERRSQIEQVLDDDAFGGTAIEERWVTKDREVDPEEPEEELDFGNLDWLVELVSVFSEIMVWIAVALVIALIVRWRDRWLPFFMRGRRRGKHRAVSQGGLLLTEEELPDDIPAQVRELWQQQRYRDALSLLYRGALTVLNDRYELDLTASDTEGDCERVVRLRLDAAPAGYFGRIALAWQRLAYGHDRPETEQVTELCDQWPVIEDAAHE